MCERVCDSLAQCRASSGWRRGVDSGGRIRVVTGERERERERESLERERELLYIM